MSITYGFYNSVNGDRKYNASDMSSIFDGIIEDGVFMSIGGALNVTATTGMNIQVDTGRAWFDHTWTNNDAILPLTLDASEVILNRIDAVVLEVNSELATRANTIKIVKGTPASSPIRPTMIDTELVHQHALAYVYIIAGAVNIIQANITNNIGTTDCPYVTGVLETIDITNLVAQWGSQWENWFGDKVTEGDAALSALISQWNNWYTAETAANEAEFNTWFDAIKGILDGDVATQLANQILALDAKIDTEVAELDAEKADVPKDYIVTFPVSGWSETAPFTQTIAVPGILDTDEGIGAIVLSNDPTVALVEDVEKTCISKITTGVDSIVVICLTTKPTIDLTFKIKAGGFIEITNNYGTSSSAEVPNDNLIINGNFDVWQRGDSQTTNGYGSDDRWNNSHWGSTKTHSKQSDPANGILNFSRTVVTSVAGANYNVKKMQAIENVALTAGKTLTLSFKAKADSAKYVAIEFAQVFGTGGSTERREIGSQKILLSNEWKTYTATVNIPSITGKTIGANNALVVFFWFNDNGENSARTSNIGRQSGTFDIAQVKLEFGDKATPFVPRLLSVEEELCRRYYRKITAKSSPTTLGVGMIISSTKALIPFNFENPMRIAPVVVTSGNLGLKMSNGSGYGVTSTITAISEEISVTLDVTCSNANFVPGAATFLYAGAANVSISFDSEL